MLGMLLAGLGTALWGRADRAALGAVRHLFCRPKNCTGFRTGLCRTAPVCSALFPLLAIAPASTKGAKPLICW
jgi:hypothetical protein